MFPQMDLAYGEGTPEEISVNSYIRWLNEYAGEREALADAVHKGLQIGDEFMNKVVSNAYESLVNSDDPAVRYFAFTLGVLPKQPRDFIPCVEWLGEVSEQSGFVQTPSGIRLGFISRRPDGFWSITPFRNGPVQVSAIANTPTDARCYLGIQMTTLAEMTIDGTQESIRLSGDIGRLFHMTFSPRGRSEDGSGIELSRSYELHLCDTDHGIEVGQTLQLRVPSNHSDKASYSLNGQVTEVRNHEVHVSGTHHITIE